MKKFVFAVLLISMLSACSFPQPTTSPSDSQTQVALFAQATLTKAAVEAQAQQTSTAIVLQPTNTETSAEVTPTTVPPTATSIPPTATNVPTVVVTPVQPPATAVPTTVPTTAPGQAIRLSFASGTTNFTAEGQLAANATKRYVFWADKSQLMDISSSGAYIAISSASGKKLVDFSQGWTWYRDYIPEKGDWYIDIKAGKYDTSYSLYLGIPQRLSFAPNTSSMTAKATIPAGRVHNFIAWGNKGQTLKVSVSPTQNFKLSIWHVDGTVLLSGMGDSSSFEGVLPEAGDYIINVISAAATPTEITLTLSIK
jgi:hypothetical protein